MKDKLLTLATDHYTAAEILKARLENAGIEVFLKHVNLIQGAASEGVKIQIKESDVEKALKMMAEWKLAQEEKESKANKSIRRILVPVDFSGHSRNACLYALKLADSLKAEVKILHVYYAPIIDLVPITDAYSIQVDMDINLQEMERRARKNLLAFVQDIKEQAAERQMSHIKMGYTLREGIVEDEISRVASAYKPGIIIAGTRGKGDTQSDIIGSVIYRVLDKTRVPVLAIPESSSFEAGKEVRNIIYATDFDQNDYVAIRRLLNILSAFKVKIWCVHVSRDARKTWDEVKMQAIKDYFKKVAEDQQLSCHLLEGDDIIKEIEAFAQQHQIDLFALTNRKRNLLSRLFDPGLTKQMIYHSSVPLLIFRV